MTAMMRQIRKQTLTIVAALPIVAAALFALPAAADGLVPQFVTDPLTGVALDGLDPVSYFTEPAPLQGLPDYEYDWQGVPWYFANAADRDVFIRSPEVYAPQFGGHATMALAQGYLSDGNPQIFTLVAKRLYLFYSTDNRDAFVLAPGPAIAKARARWTTVSKEMPAEAASANVVPAAATMQAATAVTAPPAAQ